LLQRRQDAPQDHAPRCLGQAAVFFHRGFEPLKRAASGGSRVLATAPGAGFGQGNRTGSVENVVDGALGFESRQARGTTKGQGFWDSLGA